MGRWAFFNTGVEYKFAFALQSSGDILRFGGEDVTKGSVYEVGEGEHRWTNRPEVLARLTDFAEAWGFPLPDWDAFVRDMDGTLELRRAAETLSESKGRDPAALRYVLGCLIYHQMLYEPVLTCTWEP